MEKPYIEIDEVKIELAEGNEGNEDPLTKENIIGTATNADILMGTPSIRQVCSWISDGTNGNMCVDEISIKEIKIEPADNVDNSWQSPNEKISKNVPDKLVESAQSLSLISGTASHNEQQTKGTQRPRCKFCFIPFFNKKILTKHEKKCQQLFEHIYAASNFEDVPKGMRYTNDEVGTSSRPDDVTSNLQSHHVKSACTAPVVKVMSTVKLEEHSSSSISTPDSDPLAGDIAPIPSPLVPLSITAPVLCNSLPMSISDPLKASLPAVVDTTLLTPSLSSNLISREPPPLVPICPPVCSPASIQLRPTVSSSPHADYEQKNVPVVISPDLSTVQMNKIANDVIKTKSRIQESLGAPTGRPILMDHSVLNDFGFDPLDTRNQLEEFDEKLDRDAAFADEMVSWLSGKNVDCDAKTCVEPTVDSNPSWHVIDKAEDSSQSKPSFFGTVMHNEQQSRRLRCNYCSLLFFSDKTLTNHQKKCQQVHEQLHPAAKMPSAENKEGGTSSHLGDVTPDLPPHQCKGACPSPVAKSIVNLEDDALPLIFKADPDPLACDETSILPPPLVPLTISSPGLSNPIPISFSDPLKSHHPHNSRLRSLNNDGPTAAHFGIAGVNDGTKNTPVNQNSSDTFASAKVSMEQVCSLTNDGASDGMCADEIEMEEIKIQSPNDSDPIWQLSSENITSDAIDNAEESTQSEPSTSGTALHNENRYHRPRCKYCSLLFYSEKTLTSHQEKCQQVYEYLNPAPKMPIAESKEGGTSSRPDDVTPNRQLQDFKDACTLPVAKVIANLEVEAVPPMSNTDFDPLACDLPSLVPLTISSPRLSNPLPISFPDPLKSHHPAIMNIAPVPPASISTPIDCIPPPLAPFSIGSSPSVSLLTSRTEYKLKKRPHKNATVVQHNIPLEVTAQLEQLKNAVTKLRSENCQLQKSLKMSTNRSILVYRSDLDDAVTFEPLDTRNQLEEFEEKLGSDGAFADELLAWLKRETAQCDPKTSIARSIDCIFSRELFASCSMTGKSKEGPKIPFYKFKNIQKLLRRLAFAKGCKEPADMTRAMLRNRLLIAKGRLKFNHGRKTFCKKKSRIGGPNSDAATASHFGVADVNDGTKNSPASQCNTDTSVNVDIWKDFDFEPLDTRNQLEDLEKKLGSDSAFADKMCCWLSIETGACEPKTAVALSLDLLFSRQLFASCSWSGEGRPNPKIPFYKFKNIQKLLRRLARVKGWKEPADISRAILKDRLLGAERRLKFNHGRRAFCKKKSRIGGPKSDAATASHFGVVDVNDGTKNSPASQCNTDTSVNADIWKDFDFEPLDTRNQLEEFEEKLGSDSAFVDKMCCWLSIETGACEPKIAVALSLDLLFSRQLFASCSWSGEGRPNPKIPFYKFQNIQKLLRRLARVKGCKEPADMSRAILKDRLLSAKGRLKFNHGRKTYFKKKSRIGNPNNDASHFGVADVNDGTKNSPASQCNTDTSGNADIWKDFDFEPLDTRNQLEEFEEKLGSDATFADKMCCWLSSETGACEPKTSVVLSLDLLFSRRLFARCNWFGKCWHGPRIPFYTFKNILELLWRLVIVKGCKEPADKSRAFLQNMVMAAKRRMKINPGNKTYCRKKSRIGNPNNDGPTAAHFGVAGVNDGTKDSSANQCNTDTSANAAISSVEPSMTYDSLGISKDRPILLDRSVSNDFDFEPMDSYDQLEKFESNLGSDGAFADKMVRWLSSKTEDYDAKNSVVCSLDLLFSLQLIASCSWTGTSKEGPKIPFCKFENIQKLLQQLAIAKGCTEAADVTTAVLRNRLYYALQKWKQNSKRKQKQSRLGSPNSDASNDTTDSPANQCNTDTSANADISVVNPSMEQVWSWLNDGATGDMCVDEIAIEEIEIEPCNDSNPSWQPPIERITRDAIGIAEESRLSEPSIAGRATHNEQLSRRLRCNYCSLLFYSDKTLTNHEKKCQKVYEQLNPAPKMPIAESKEGGTSSRPDDVTPNRQLQDFKDACTLPVAKVLANLEVEAVPPMSNTDFDPLACDLPPLVPLTISSPGLGNSLPTAIPDPLKPQQSTFVETAPFLPLSSVPIHRIPPTLAPLSIGSPVSIHSNGNQWQYNNGTVPQQTIIPSDIIFQLERTKNEVAMLKEQNCRLRESLGLSTDCFDFEPLATRNQLEELEEKLGRDATFADELVAWLKRETADCDPKTSIVRSIDCLFTRVLFASCTWRGLGRHGTKIPFYNLKNIHTVFQRVASTLSNEAPAALIEKTLRSRLNNAADRAKSKFMRKAHCIPSRQKKIQCEKE